MKQRRIVAVFLVLALLAGLTPVALADTGPYELGCDRVGHSWSGWKTTKSPTCTAQGSEERTCTRCGKKETKPIAAKGHSFKYLRTEQAATCTEDGIALFTCPQCSAKENRKIKAKGHEWDEGVITQPEGLLEPGIKTFTCLKCGETRTEEIPASMSGSSGKTIMSNLKNIPDGIPEPEEELRIVKQPVGGTISHADGESLVLSVEAEGGVKPYSYTWRYELSWLDYLGTPGLMPIAGEGSPILEVSEGGKNIFCDVRDAAGSRVRSDTVTVNGEFCIVQQPQNTNIRGKESVKLTCRAAGGEPFDGAGSYIYTWYKNDSSIDISDYGDLEVTEEGEYYCTVMDNMNVLLTSEKAVVYDADPIWVKCDTKYASIEPGSETYDILMNFGGGAAPLTCAWYLDDELLDSHPADGHYDWRTADSEGIYTMTVSDIYGGNDSFSVKVVDHNIHIVEQTGSATLSEENKTATLSATIIGGVKPYTVWWYWKGPNGESGVVETQEISGSESSCTAEIPGTYYCIAHDPGNFHQDISDYIPVGYTGGPYITLQPEGSTVPAGGEADISVPLTCRAVSMSTGNDDNLEYTWEVRDPNRTYWRIAGSGTKCNARNIGEYRCVVTDTLTGEMTSSESAFIFRKLEYVGGKREGSQVNGSSEIWAEFRGGTPPYQVEMFARMLQDTKHDYMAIPVMYRIIDNEAGLSRIGAVNYIFYSYINYDYEPPKSMTSIKQYYFVVTDALGQECTSGIIY